MDKEEDTKLWHATWAVDCPTLIMRRFLPTMINYIWKMLPGLVSGCRHLLTEHNCVAKGGAYEPHDFSLHALLQPGRPSRFSLSCLGL